MGVLFDSVGNLGAETLEQNIPPNNETNLGEGIAWSDGNARNARNLPVASRAEIRKFWI